jgi:hypothetical protein
VTLVKIGGRTIRVQESLGTVRMEEMMAGGDGCWFTLTAVNGEPVKLRAGTITSLIEERAS